MKLEELVRAWRVAQSTKNWEALHRELLDLGNIIINKHYNSTQLGAELMDGFAYDIEIKLLEMDAPRYPLNNWIYTVLKNRIAKELVKRTNREPEIQYYSDSSIISRWENDVDSPSDGEVEIRYILGALSKWITWWKGQVNGNKKKIQRRIFIAQVLYDLLVNFRGITLIECNDWMYKKWDIQPRELRNWYAELREFLKENDVSN